MNRSKLAFSSLRRTRPSQPIGVAMSLAGAIVLAACSGAAPSPTSSVPILTPSPTAPLVSPTIAPTPTATILPTVTFQPPTATAFPATSTAQIPISTATIPTPTPTALAYTADFAAWFSGTESTPFPFRAGFDLASGEYRLALTDARRGYVYYRPSPDGRTFGDFRLDIDVRRVAGPDNGVYGVVFRIQSPLAGAATFERYNFTITPDGFYSLALIKTDGTATVIAPRAASSAIKQGNALNHLTVIATGNQLTLSINGEALGTFNGPVAGPGGVGVYVGNPPNSASAIGIEAGFSNLHIAIAP